ncbi:MAG: hypothetical protein GAK28_00614 [Luteibacter sp.]|uniref:hypothetical protein n=1 Tax=Luteibacter sp. TaxID=1886636 RepID=UPI0013822752|nr:hypothetical protein [Luteibacter sp.]KAF1008982.1 MAG: hypothetical protein GAK28_00614 [Luteibacter sp.]
MNRPVIDNQWTLGNIVSAATATITLLTVVGSMAWRVFSIDASAAQVSQALAQSGQNKTDIVQLRSDVDMLKQRRAEDAGAVQNMRTEIVGRLERIEGKLDQKADKQPLREWTK